jgi:hypothetical protein
MKLAIFRGVCIRFFAERPGQSTWERGASPAKPPAPHGSELYFLAGRSHVACFAEPAVRSELEGAVILVAEECSGLVAPVAANHVRIAEIRVRSEDVRRDLFLIGDQVVAAKYFSCRRSNDLSGQ